MDIGEIANAASGIGTALAAFVAAIAIPVALVQMRHSRFVQMEALFISLLQDYVKGRRLPDLSNPRVANHELWTWSASNLLIGTALDRLVSSMPVNEVASRRTQKYVDDVIALLQEDREQLKAEISELKLAAQAPSTRSRVKRAAHA